MEQEARRARGSGFALVEVIVALAVLLILAAVALPQLAGYLDQKRIEATAEQLVIVRDALFKSGTGFSQVVGTHAGRLSHLVIPITSTDRSACNALYSTQERNNWDDEGPYVNFVIDGTAGMATPIGMASNTLTRVVVAGQPTRLRITWPATSLTDATDLDTYVDVTAGWNAGTVQWTPQLGVDGVVQLTYDVVIDATC
jgi:prepilin-type N-terminal cleavage/methylation domain-containing protein